MRRAKHPDDWSDYDRRLLRHGVKLGCVILGVTFLAGAFSAIMVIWFYQELGFRF